MRPSGPDAPGALSRRRAEPLESLVIDGLPEHAVPVFEAALEQVCTTVALFRDEPTDTWRIEGVREAGAHDDALGGHRAVLVVRVHVCRAAGARERGVSAHERMGSAAAVRVGVRTGRNS